MARKAFPRRSESHELIASEVLRKHAQRTGVPIRMPIPIELIIEQTYELEIMYDVIAEPPGLTILGALAPTRRQIIINSTHEGFLTDVFGPERFTFAHELAHWIYDAENPDQLSLDLDSAGHETFCYHRDSPGLPDQVWVREINANKLAAAILLPEGFMREAVAADILGDLRGWARRWGVSQQSLRIRLGDLGLIDEAGIAGLDFH